MNLETLRRLSGISKKKEATGSKKLSLNEKNQLRALAGMKLLTEEDVTVDDAPAASTGPDDMDTYPGDQADDLSTDNKTGSEDEDALVKSLKHIANHAEGKVGQDLLDIIRQVYDAGLQDGKAQAEEAAGEDVPAEDTPVDDSEEAAGEDAPADTGTDDVDADGEKEETEEATVEESVKPNNDKQFSKIVDDLRPIDGAIFTICFSNMEKQLVADNVATGMKTKHAYQVVLSGIIHKPSVAATIAKLQEIEDAGTNMNATELVRAYHE